MHKKILLLHDDRVEHRRRRIIDITGVVMITILLLLLYNSSTKFNNCFQNKKELLECARGYPVEFELKEDAKKQSVVEYHAPPEIVPQLPIFEILFHNLPEQLTNSEKTMSELETIFHNRAILKPVMNEQQTLVLVAGVHSENLEHEINQINIAKFRKGYSKCAILLAIISESCEFVYHYLEQLPSIIYNMDGMRIEVTVWNNGELLHCASNDQAAARITKYLS